MPMRREFAVIESRANYTASDYLCNVVRQGRSDVPQCPDVKVACLAHSCHMVIECHRVYEYARV